MLTVKKYKKLLKCKGYDSMVGVVFDLTPPEIDDLDIKEYNSKVKEILKLKKRKEKTYKELSIGENTLHYKGWKSLTYGEYLDTLNYAKEDKIEYLYAIFYRVEISPQTPLNKRELEPYDFDIDHRAKFLENADIKYFFTIKKDMEKLDEIINKNYRTIFEEAENTDVTQIKDAREKQMFLHNQRIKQAYNQNAWEYTTHALSGEDPTKYNAVHNLPLFTVLNSLKLSKSLELKNKTKG